MLMRNPGPVNAHNLRKLNNFCRETVMNSGIRILSLLKYVSNSALEGRQMDVRLSCWFVYTQERCQRYAFSCMYYTTAHKGY
ncbi:hypothetical protein E2C01_005004 [Portunus trituberculatus]|uniref:Uncharacterized protein n=1 Tax=Portunus trituberculatus TaxID=210409 RepID=A0A5B7CS11_PORTR|nr:hypothetical protein [Portunus trituberculatus]